MWFLYALLTTVIWGGADLFYKKGSNPEDRYSDLKIVTAVGFVMGIHCLFFMLMNGLSVPFGAIIRYLPVSFFYISSMYIGYKGLRYLELSVSSPVQNSSGAVTTVLLLIFTTSLPGSLQIAAIFAVLAGTILLAVFEPKDKVRISAADKKYRTSFKAIMFPIVYCILDGIGTFLDGLYLDEYGWIAEDDALIAYELTFLICGTAVFIYLLFKKVKFSFKMDYSKGLAAILETAGQYFYVYAMTGRAVIAAPIVSSYCVFSVIFSRIFLKEKLRKKQYAAIACVVAGIIVLGICEGLGE